MIPMPGLPCANLQSTKRRLDSSATAPTMVYEMVARRPTAILGPEEQVGESSEVVGFAGIHRLTVQCSHLKRQPIHRTS
jgi:hypothetical protein